MPTKFRFPYPCQYYPHLRTQHEAATLIEEYQAGDHIKKCAHLHIATFGGGYDARYYGPGCRKDSFSFQDVRLGERLFCGCPKDCRLYKPAWKSKIEGWLTETWRSLRQTIVGIGQYYASLNGTVQVLILVIILAIVGTPLLKAVAEVLRIVYPR